MYKVPKRVAVLGAGVMGSRIACHVAQSGAEVLLLDLPAPTDQQPLADQQLQQLLKERPAPLYLPTFASRIQTGSFTADMAKLSHCDWVIEAVAEDFGVKQKLYEEVEKYRGPDTIVSSNTSGLSLARLAEGRSKGFREHFCGTHFFNPPRYLPLLELIPSSDTSSELIAFLSDYGSRFLGKEIVHGKDTPAFVGNRIGIFSLLSTLSAMQAADFSVGEIDLLTGPLVGRPRSATFRTLDLVGLDVFMKVAEYLYEALPEDEQRALFRPPQLLRALYEQGHWGEKRGQGFYKKIKTATGTEIHEIHPSTQQYAARRKRHFSELESVRAQDELVQRVSALLALEGALGSFYRAHFYALFAYCSQRLPEIAEDVHSIDTALRAGFGWEKGPFQLWEALGIAQTAEVMQAAGHVPAAWVETAASTGVFYKTSSDKLQVFMPSKQALVPLSSQQALRLQNQRVVWENASASLYDIGEGVFCLASRSKMNILNAEVFSGIETGLERAEKEGQGLVIGQETPQFSAGADLGLLLSYALEQEYEEIDLLVRQFQRAVLRLRYSAVPVVVAVRGLALGGGCELVMHCDLLQAHAETYIGLVEIGAGLIPAGGGTKEMAARLSEAMAAEDVVMNRLQAVFKTIATAEVSTSAHEGKRLGYLRPTDQICMSAARLIGEAKRALLRLAEAGYTPPLSSPIHVQGAAGLALLGAGIATMQRAGYASEHDVLVARKLAYVLNGGSLSSPAFVSEAYLLDLEREAFLSLCSEPKTLARMQHILRKGKPLRN